MRVLIVENEPYNVELLIVRLEGLGCEPAVAVTPAEACRLAREWAPALILLDLRLGGRKDDLGGMAVLDELRRNEATARIPVIVHSILMSRPEDAPDDLPPIQGFLTKPFRLEDLRLFVEAHRPETPAERRPQPKDR